MQEDIIQVMLLKNGKEMDINIKMEPEDAEILREGCVDYIGFSYYMSAAVKSENDVEDGDGLCWIFYRLLKIHMLKQSDWGWQIDPVGLRYSLKFVI